MDLPKLLDGRLKLRHLVLVDTLSEQGSVVGAAARLRVTQPVVTRALRELEGILGLPLYARGPRGVTPTIYGAAFTEHARSVLAQVTQAGRHLTELADAELGTVTVGSHLAGTNTLLPRAVALLKAVRPHVTVVIREAPPSALSSDLEAGRVDFIVGRITGVETGSVTHEHLYDEPIRLVTRIGHPAHALPDPTIADLLDYPWILPGPETGLRAELEQVFAAQHAHLPANRIECTSILTLRHLLADTDTITAMPLSIASEDSQIAPLPVSLHPVSYTVGISHPVGRRPSPSAAALLLELRNVAADMGKSTPDASSRS